MPFSITPFTKEVIEESLKRIKHKHPGIDRLKSMIVLVETKKNQDDFKDVKSTPIGFNVRSSTSDNPFIKVSQTIDSFNDITDLSDQLLPIEVIIELNELDTSLCQHRSDNSSHSIVEIAVHDY